MDSPKVSVVIPTYNGADSLREALQSVLDQTYAHLEILVVDDASTDESFRNATPVVDARVRYLQHPHNMGALVARKTGVHASTGEIIAFLDQDDLFHPAKLEAHVAYLRAHPGTGATYNARFDVQGPDKRPCGIHRPPAELRLDDWVLGFPLSPSDVVITRQWALRDDVWEDSFATHAEHAIFNGGEIVFGGRLALAGCTFGRVDRALNYRRHHPHRVLRHLAQRCQMELACQDVIFTDPRCPPSVRALKGLASANIYVMWAYTAYMQEEFDLGKQLLEEAIALYPAFFEDSEASPFLSAWLSWISAGTVDYVRGHAEILTSVFDNLPVKLEALSRRREWAIARSHLLKGLHTMIWGRREDAEASLATGIERGARIDAAALGSLSDELCNYGTEFGPAATQQVLTRLSSCLARLGRGAEARRLVAYCAVGRAFRGFQSGRFHTVPAEVARAIRSDPRYLLNRGVLSIFVRSLYYQRVSPTGAIR